MEQQDLSPQQLRNLDSVQGWLMLGCPSEAIAELDALPSTLQSHPQVLDARWQTAAAMRDWETALSTANRLLTTVPEDATGWIHRSYALRRSKTGGLQQAWDALLPAVEKFPKVSTIPYNIACYAAQLGQLSEAWDWLHRAIEAAEDISLIKTMALKDADLMPLWDRLKRF